MMAVTVVRISGARLVAARKKPNITQMKPCQTLSPAYRCSSHTATPSTRTSETEIANTLHRPSALAAMIAPKRSEALAS